jgi:hypothetical protein
MATFASDYKFGTSNELIAKTKLEKIFMTTLIHRTEKPMTEFDYDNGATFHVELKTRRIRHDQYPTAIIGKNKVDIAAANPDRTYWFCFNYSDGMYGIKYDKEKFEKYNVSDFSRGDRPDFHNNAQTCCFIPHQDLIHLTP